MTKEEFQDFKKKYPEVAELLDDVAEVRETKKTVFYYVRQAFATYGVIVLVFAIMSIVIGERTKDYAALFFMGNAGMSMPILMELLLLAVIITLSQVVFLTDTWIMNLSMMIRNVLFLCRY